MVCSINTRLPLRVVEIYSIYCQMLYKGILKYLINGEDENIPSWCSAEIYEMIDSQMHTEGHFS